MQCLATGVWPAKNAQGALYEQDSAAGRLAGTPLAEAGEGCSVLWPVTWSITGQGMAYQNPNSGLIGALVGHDQRKPSYLENTPYNHLNYWNGSCACHDLRWWVGSIHWKKVPYVSLNPMIVKVNLVRSADVEQAWRCHGLMWGASWDPNAQKGEYSQSLFEIHWPMTSQPLLSNWLVTCNTLGWQQPGEGQGE